MILQYVAASLVSENKTLCHPASVDSIPSSANQEDHVSMGAIGAKKLQSVVRNVTRVLAIEYLCAAQALEFAEKTPGAGTGIAHRLLRDRVPPLKEDREGTFDIEQAARLIEEGVLVEEVPKKFRCASDPSAGGHFLQMKGNGTKVEIIARNQLKVDSLKLAFDRLLVGGSVEMAVNAAYTSNSFITSRKPEAVIFG